MASVPGRVTAKILAVWTDRIGAGVQVKGKTRERESTDS